FSIARETLALTIVSRCTSTLREARSPMVGWEAGDAPCAEARGVIASKASARAGAKAAAAGTRRLIAAAPPPWAREPARVAPDPPRVVPEPARVARGSPRVARGRARRGARPGWAARGAAGPGLGPGA